MKVLGIGAHPDDIEIFMYGLLSIYKKEGHQVYTMIATDGAKGGAITGNKLGGGGEEGTREEAGERERSGRAAQSAVSRW